MFPRLSAGLFYCLFFGLLQHFHPVPKLPKGLVLPIFHAAGLPQGKYDFSQLVGGAVFLWEENGLRADYPSPFISLAAEDDNKKFSTLAVISANTGMGKF